MLAENDIYMNLLLFVAYMLYLKHNSDTNLTMSPLQQMSFTKRVE